MIYLINIFKLIIKINFTHKQTNLKIHRFNIYFVFLLLGREKGGADYRI